MKTPQRAVALLATLVIGGTLLAPFSAMAQGRRDLDWIDALTEQSKRRQQKKNEWRNIAIGAGAVGIYGLLKKDNTLMFTGAAGALYSAWRYEQDRKSQSKIDRARAGYFSRQSFYRDGKRYSRRTVWKNGKKYYQFVRG